MVTPSDSTAAKRFDGEPITMQLKDAELKNVIRTFGKLTGLKMKVDESISGSVTVNWVGVSVGSGLRRDPE